MPRRPRVILPNTPLHIIQRGNNRQACFFADEDYQFYLDWLLEYAKDTGCEIHAYVLMTNHVHLLLSGHATQSVGRLMKALGQRYVQYVNRTYQRTGSLWEGRFRSCLTREETYVLACYRYIELNPVRAAMVEHPADYPWSSYRCNAQGETNKLITPHEQYQLLGESEKDRSRAYRELFRYELDPGMVDQIRKATNGNFVLGSDKFSAQVEAMLGRRVTRGVAGRPRNEVDQESGALFR